MRKELSIIVVTKNRCELLKELLESILRQKGKKRFEYEVIIADNGSTDSTKRIVKEFQESSDIDLVYLYDERTGRSRTCNKAIGQAKGNIIVFTDDDVIVAEDWIEEIYNCFKETKADAIGGKILTRFPKHVKHWTMDYMDILTGPYVNHDYGEGILPYQRPDMRPFVGANMAIRKKVLEELGGYREDLGPGAGTFGDDTDLFMKLYYNQKKIVYCGKALVWHQTDENRLSLRFIAKYKMAFGRYSVQDRYETENSEKLKKYFGVPRYLYREIVREFFRIIFKFYNKRALLEAWCIFFQRLGMILAYRNRMRSGMD